MKVVIIECPLLRNFIKFKVTAKMKALPIDSGIPLIIIIQYIPCFNETHFCIRAAMENKLRSEWNCG